MTQQYVVAAFCRKQKFDFNSLECWMNFRKLEVMKHTQRFNFLLTACSRLSSFTNCSCLIFFFYVLLFFFLLFFSTFFFTSSAPFMDSLSYNPLRPLLSFPSFFGSVFVRHVCSCCGRVCTCVRVCLHACVCDARPCGQSLLEAAAQSQQPQ